MKFKLFILLVINVFLYCNCTDVTVKTENGLVKGTTIQSNNKLVNVFYGIKYGKAPIGNLRFKKPEKVDDWTGVYDATTIPQKNSCWQAYHFLTKFFNQSDDQVTQIMTEDCLLLNVWTTTDLRTNDFKLKPVMVWIHGGALAIGSSLFGTVVENEYKLVYDCAPLSTFDTVVVSINYRLGPLGFVYAGNDQAPGNVGLYDQSLALQWVKNNIRAFGGDPNDVTIFGESAGSWSVSYHILSPISKDLFKKAILQSGAEFDNEFSNDKSVALNVSKQHAIDNGCEDNVNWLQCLKNLDPKSLFNYNFHLFDLKFLPVVSENFFPLNAYDAFKQGKFNSNIKVIAGTTANEGDFLILFDDRNIIIPAFSTNLTNSKARSVLSHYLDKIKPKSLKSEKHKKRVIDYYLSDKSDSDLLKSSISHVIGDHYLVCPTFNFAKQIASWSSDNKVYFYKYNHRGHFTFDNSLCNFSWSGVCHGAELPYVFGIPLQFSDFSKEDAEFSYLMMKLWTNFAKTGNPLKNDEISSQIDDITIKYKDIKWPIFKKEDNNIISQVMVLDYNNFGNILNDPYEICEVLWKEDETQFSRDEL